MAKKGKKDKKDKRAEVAPAEVLMPVVADELAGGGAGLCYGEPVRESGRTVIPVARVGGSRDALGARPVGYIEVDAAGTRFTAIGGPSDRVLTGAIAAAGALLGALVGAVIGRRGR